MCTECIYKNMTPIQGDCRCEDFKYLSKGACEDCPPLCIKCFPFCTKCVNNANVNSSSLCECDLGFRYVSENNSCIKHYFSGVLTILSITLAKLTFSESFLSNITEESFVFSITNRTDLKTNLLKVTENFEFTFGLSFKNSVENNTQLQVSLSPHPLYSKNRSQLKDYHFKGSLPSFTPVIIDPSIQVILGSIGAVVQAAVSTSVGSSIISNPAAAWALLNSIQILVFLPLNSNKLTPNLRTFLKGFAGYNILPNLFSFLDEKASSEPYLEARSYGLKTSMFLINTGKILLIFVMTLLMWPFLYALSKCQGGAMAAKAIKILGNYKYSFFLRYWTQSILEILIFSVVQLKAVKFM
jgi:hypothetical protein